jgi:glycosyltransferase involved in cell wall biosynthesis
MFDAWLSAGFFTVGRALDVIYDTVWDAHAAVQFAIAAGAYIRLLLKCVRRRTRPDIAHLHVSVNGSLYRQLIACKLCRTFGVRVVAHIHSGAFFEWIATSRFANRAAHALFSDADATIVLAEHWRSAASARGARNIHVVPHFLSASLMATLSPARDRPKRGDGKTEVLFYGRWAPVKGLDVLARALARLDDQTRSHIRLRVFGNGDRVWAEDITRLAGVRVEIGGWLADVEKPAALRRADVVVVPSRHEGFNQALLEAVAAHRPIVASSVGAMPEILRAYSYSRLFPAGDSAALADAIANVVSGNWPNAVCRGVEETLERFSARAAGDALHSVYSRVLR